jgi:hypothetical protein
VRKRRRRKKKKKSWMYVMVDEPVDFVFDAAAVVVFLFENLYKISIRSVIQISKRKRIPEVDSTGAVGVVVVVVVVVPQFIDPIDTALKGIVGTPPLLPLVSNRPKLPFDFKFEVVVVEADDDEEEEANFVL